MYFRLYFSGQAFIFLKQQKALLETGPPLPPLGLSVVDVMTGSWSPRVNVSMHLFAFGAKKLKQVRSQKLALLYWPWLAITGLVLFANRTNVFCFYNSSRFCTIECEYYLNANTASGDGKAWWRPKLCGGSRFTGTGDLFPYKSIGPFSAAR